MDPYDALPYPGGAFPRSHPAHIGAIARLFGVPAADPRGARVLEIGCSEGLNLLPMAAALPRAAFVGVDPARAPLAAAEALRREAGLENVALHPVGVEAIDPSWGPFDMVVCHGVWSWVGPETRAAILETCARCLAPGGVAYVSYNTLPGWYLQMPARDLMRRHAAGFADPVERVAQARAVLELLRDGGAPQASMHVAVVRELAARLAGKADGYLFHEYLAAHHEPVYFTDFAAAAARAGLRYLAEAELSWMFDHDLPEAGREGLALLGGELLAREQLLDFLRGRTFRATLLVREGTPIARRWTADRLDGLWLRSRLRRDFSGEMPPPLARLHAVAPMALPSDQAAPTPADRAAVLDLLSRGFVEASLLPPSWTTEPGPAPVATPLARAQARAGEWVVSLDHQGLCLDDAQRALVASADGRTRLPEGAVAALARACLWLAPTA